MNEIKEFFSGLFSTNEWPPRWDCGYWSDFHGWLYIMSELMVWTAYFLIPLLILNYVSKKQTGIKFKRVYFLFASFILLCGSTHFFDALMFWIPMYRFNALLRLITGIVSLVTVYHMVKILPEVFAQKTNLELEREIAKRQKAEEELAEANKRLEAFAYVASHDLQEPLRKISTFSSLLFERNETVFDAKSKELAAKIEASTGRMQTMIHDVLTLSTIKEDVPFTSVNAGGAVQKAIDDLEVKIAQKDAVIQVDDLPAVKGNEAYLSLLFLNLINNALKFTKQQPRIHIWGENTGDTARIHVSDNGIGIEEKDAARIFEAFQRLKSKTEYEGTGIGLAICKKIADIHSGHIEVKSRLNEGTTFTVVLPAAHS